MLADAEELVKAMKRAAVAAQEATKPVYVYFGIVETASPLTVNVEQKMLLDESQLILSRNVTDFTTMVTVDCVSESSISAHSHNLGIISELGGDPEHIHSVSGKTGIKDLAHTHNITGKKKITIHNALGVGEKVIILRQQEGQKFIVWDRIGGQL